MGWRSYCTYVGIGAPKSLTECERFFSEPQSPKQRIWVVIKVDKMADPNITFATEKAKIVEVLQKRKADDLYDAMLTQTRPKSKIIFAK